jgi:hypothetical protein
VHGGSDQCATPLFADWGLQLLEWIDGLSCPQQPPYDGDPCTSYTYIPHPGGQHGWPATHIRTTCTYDRLIAAGAPTAVMIRNRNCPFPYDDGGHATSPDTIDEVLAYVPDIDFVFMDLEGNSVTGVFPNVLEVVSRARAVNPAVHIGNYSYFPGEYDGSRPYENQADRTNDFWGADLNEQYLTSGMDVAMPSCYPYEYYVRHTLSGHYSGTSPNVRAALFWAPLERLSVAGRDLPDGHLLIPWVSAFIPWDGYEAPEPPLEDITALMQHFRLRGADAFYAYSPGPHPGLTQEQYLALARGAWLALDARFPAGSEPEVLNLETDKPTGIEWSGMRTVEQLVILVSNLTDAASLVGLPALEGLPEAVPVDAFTHELLVFDRPPCPADLDGNATVNVSDVLALMMQWGPCPPPCSADLDGSGAVGISDFLGLLGDWGSCP